MSAEPAGADWRDWAGWVRRLDGMARIGGMFATDPYDAARYRELADIVRSMTAALTGRPPDAVPDPYDRDEGYVTPKVDVRAAVPHADGRVLLVRERADGRWTLPGGWADLGESPALTAVREVREEAGYEVAPRGLVGVYDETGWTDPPSMSDIYKIVVRCELIGGEARESHETTGVGWYGAHDLPELSPRRTPPRLLARVLAHLADPTLPADVD